jgi:hypothetical protein
MTKTEKIRVGFASRYFERNGPVGAVAQGLIPMLSKPFPLEILKQLSLPKEQDESATLTWATGTVEISVFFIDGVRALQADEHAPPTDSKGRPIDVDPVRTRLANGVAWLYYLPQDIGICAKAIREADLDILVYPETGMDPISYFLSYARLAPVQASWYVHPDTTGILAVDYFLSSDVELPDADNYYSEKLVRFHGLGTFFVDTYANYTQVQQLSPRTALLDRAKLIEFLNVPRLAHLYVVPHSLYKLHGSFDEVLSKILLQDRLGYIIILDFQAFRPTWQSLFINRLAGKFSAEVR